MVFPNKVYDFLKWVAQFLLPGLGVLYFGIGSIWNFPYVEEVLGTITAIDVFIGTLLGLSNLQYQANKYLNDRTKAVIDGYPPVNSIEDNSLNMTSSVKVYDVLKWATLILLPAVGTLYFALASIWHFPYGEQVIGTISVITSFMGIMLGISTVQYKKLVYPPQ